MLALQIAGGILLAVVLIALSPFIVAVLPYVIGLAVVVGASVLAWLIWPGTLAPLIAFSLAFLVVYGAIGALNRRLYP